MRSINNKLSAVFLIGVLSTPATFFGQVKMETGDLDQDSTFLAPLAPAPIFVAGASNTTCAELRDMNIAGLGQMLDAWEFKVDSPPFGVNTYRLDGSNGGTLQGGPPNANMSVTYDRVSNTTIGSWQINASSASALDRRVAAVIVKGGSQGKNVYSYNPVTTSDVGPFSTPGARQAISHVSFCFERSLAPSAATVSVSGRVVDGKQAISRARVNIVDENGQTRSVVTNSFGYYHFDDVEVGQTYIISVFSKGYQFTPRLISIQDELTDLDFAPQE